MPRIDFTKGNHTYVWQWEDTPAAERRLFDDFADKAYDPNCNLDLFDSIVLTAKVSDINIKKQKDHVEQNLKQTKKILDELDQDLKSFIDFLNNDDMM